MLIEIVAQQYPNERGLVSSLKRELELVKESSVLEDAIELQRRLGRMSVLVDRAKLVITEDTEMMFALRKEVELAQENASRLEVTAIPKQDPRVKRERPPVTSRRPARSRASSHTT